MTVRDVLLVGGGHAHVQLLRRFAMAPLDRAQLTVVLDRPVAVYSGMVPGFVAGHYSRSELEIDVVPLARWAGARVVLARATGVDAGARRVELAGRPSLRYDVASFDIGSTVAGLDLPGVRDNALATRPIVDLVAEIDDLVARAERHPSGEPFRVVVVGGGAGGVELAFTMQHRLASIVKRVELTLVHEGPSLLPTYPKALRDRVLRRAGARGIRVKSGARTIAVRATRVELEGGDSLPCDVTVWVTGAVSQPVFRKSGLPTDDRGFVKVRSTLQVEGHDDLFAVGDCATLTAHVSLPKAGVYAVREGPVLADNVRALLDRRTLTTYEPQQDFLALLNLGDGDAIGAKWGRTFEGRRVMKLKDWIDRRFMRKFQILDPDGDLTATFANQPAMEGGDPMLCGGCAAKVGQSVLDRALGRLSAHPADDSVVLGLATPDDASAYETPRGDVVVSSVDAFRGFTDDAYLVGRIAAVNSVSDLYAKGVTPRHALAFVALPANLDDDASEELLFQVLSGARAALDPLGVTLMGGHTTTSEELIVGFSVDGTLGDGAKMLTGDRLAPGEVLVLTKPLGTGVLLHADMRGRTRGPWLEAALASMLRTNRGASEIAVRHGVTAATDVTGFGLVGHLSTMLRASGVSAELDVASLPALAGALELFARGFESTFHPVNVRARRGIRVDAGVDRHPRFPLLFDPQTSGGLVLAVPEEDAGAAIEELREGGDPARVIGRVTARRQDGALVRVVASSGESPSRQGPRSLR